RFNFTVRRSIEVYPQEESSEAPLSQADSLYLNRRQIHGPTEFAGAVFHSSALRRIPAKPTHLLSVR
ncbi:MAG: hypothetical protein V4599_02250, partial [Verrucomicrobiota bacterium]